MIFIFDKYEEMKAVLSNDGAASFPFWDDEMTTQLSNGVALFEFSCPADHELSAHIEVEGFAGVKDLDGGLKLFKIREVADEKTDSGAFIRTVKGESVALELLGEIIRPITLETYTASQAMTHVLNGSRWQMGVIEWAGTKTVEIDGYITALAAIHEIRSQFGAELRFRVEMQGSAITGRYVDLVQRIGSDTGMRFEYTKDIVSIRRTEDADVLATALIGVGASDSNENAASFTNIAWSLANGNPANKPAGQDWVGDPEALSIFGIDGKHKFGVFESDTTDPAELLSQTWNELQNRKQPRLSYEVGAVLLEKISGYEQDKKRMGDTIIVKDNSFVPAILVEARIVEMTTSMSDPMKDRVVLDNFVQIDVKTHGELLAQLQSIIRQKESQWSQGEVITKSPTPPSNPVDGQLWLDTTNPAMNVWKKWNGTSWIKATPTEAAEVGAATPEEVRDMSESERLKGAKIQAYKEKSAIDEKHSSVNGHPQMYTVSVKNELAAAKTDIDSKYSAMVTAIDNVVADGTVTDPERADLDVKTESYRLAISRYEKAFAAAQDDISAGRTADAEAAATDFTETYANKKIVQSSVPPSNPVIDDLWIDVSVVPYVWKRWNGLSWEKAVPTTAAEIGAEAGIRKGDTAPSNPALDELWLDSSASPPVWKQWNGGAWIKLTRTDLSELLGKLETDQLSDQVVTRNKLAVGAVGTDQLEAGAINEEKMKWSTHLLF